MIYNGVEYEIDKDLSNRDFTGWNFTEQGYDFSGKVIFNSCFSQERPDTNHIPGTKGATFIKCNLTNLLIPESNEIIECNVSRIAEQNDLNDWFIDEDNNPTKPLDYKYFIKKGLPIPKPEDIPEEKVEKRINLKGEKEAVEVIKDGVVYEIPMEVLDGNIR